MSKQPKALRLIGQLDEIAKAESVVFIWALDAVNELERLHKVNQELVEALKTLSCWTSLSIHNEYVKPMIEALLAKARGEA